MPETPTAPETPTPGWFTADAPERLDTPPPSWLAPAAYPTEPAPVAKPAQIKSDTREGMHVVHTLTGPRVTHAECPLEGIHGYGEGSVGWAGPGLVEADFDPGVQTEEATKALKDKLPPHVYWRTKGPQRLVDRLGDAWGKLFDEANLRAKAQGGEVFAHSKNGGAPVLYRYNARLEKQIQEDKRFELEANGYALRFDGLKVTAATLAPETR